MRHDAYGTQLLSAMLATLLVWMPTAQVAAQAGGSAGDTAVASTAPVFPAPTLVERAHHEGSADASPTRATAPTEPTRMTYDVLDRATETTLPDGSTMRQELGLVSALDGAGLWARTRVIDGEGRPRDALRDARERVRAMVEHLGGREIVTRYEYDPLEARSTRDRFVEGQREASSSFRAAREANRRGSEAQSLEAMVGHDVEANEHRVAGWRATEEVARAAPEAQAEIQTAIGAAGIVRAGQALRWGSTALAAARSARSIGGSTRGCIGMCREFAGRLQSSLSQRGIRGTRITMRPRTNYGVVSSDRHGALGGPGSEHVAIEVDGVVFDNMNWRGIRANDFWDDLGGRSVAEHGMIIVREDF